MKDQKRNMNPHKAAVVAMWIYGKEYADQYGGIMDDWDKLPESKRDVCRRLLIGISNAPDEK